MKLSITCITIILTAFVTGSLVGQDNNPTNSSTPQSGRIGGKVLNADTGQVISSASIALLEDAAYFERTDLEGRFVFSDVPVGTYTVRVFKSGFQPYDVTGVEVIGGEVTRIDIPLPPRSQREQREAVESSGEVTSGTSQDDIFELAAFEVTAEVVRNSEVGLLELRQQSVTIGDAIGSDFLSRTGVSDVAQAMTKVVGASVVGGKYVLIRGLGDRYSNTLLNGVAIPSADPDKRAVQMDQFPSDLMDSIITTKSFTPDQPGSFSGGSLNMITQTFPLEFFFKAGTSIGYNTNTTGESILNVPGGGRDWMAMDDGTRALPGNLPGAFPFPTLINIRARQGDFGPAEEFQRINDSFDNRSFFPTTKSARPNMGFNFSLGDQIDFDRSDKALGYVLSFTYDNSLSHYTNGSAGRYNIGSSDPASEGFIDNLLVFDRLENMTYADAYSQDPNYPDANVGFGVTETQQDVSWGSFGQISFRFNRNHQVSLASFFNQSADETIKRGLGESTRSDTGRIYERVTINYTERSVGSYQIQGKSIFPNLMDATLDWRLSYSVSTQDQPDYRSIFSFWDFRNEEFASSNGRNSRYFRELEDDQWEGALDLTIPFIWRNGLTGKIKFGGVLSQGGRDYDGESFAYANLIATAEDRLNFPNPVGIISQNGNRFVFGNYLERVGVNPDYRATQEIEAGYLMADIELSEQLKAVFGVRYESTLLETNPEFDRATPAELDEAGWLPALSLIYKLTTNTNLKFAYGKTIARPIFKEITDVRIEDDFLDTFYSGNPDLDLSVIDNFDLRWEWFPRPGEIIAASVFYKSIDKPIEVLFNSDIGAIQPDNREKGELYGIEFEYRRNLDALSDALTGFSLGFNFSLIESEVNISDDELASIRSIFPEADDKRELLGQSPYTANIDLSWESEEKKILASLLFNIFGKRLDLVNFGPLPDVYEQPSPTLDFVASKGIGEHWQVKFSAKNLLDPDREKSFSHNGVDYSLERYSSGRSFSLSVSYSH